jgi:hypothetical protein
MSAPSRPESFRTFAVDAMRPVLPGLLLGVCTLLFGFGMGAVFGLNEALIKDRLSSSAAAVATTVYQGDAAASKAVVDKSWTYMQRAHLHAGSLGAVAVVLSLVLVLLGTGPALARALSVGLGAGGLGYSVFWMWAGFIAPGLGSTGAAKESLKLLAMPSSGAVMVCTVTVAVLVARAWLSPSPTANPAVGRI